MIVTRVIIDPSRVKTKGNGRQECFLGCAHVTLDDALTIHNIKIIQLKDEHPFLDFPSRALPAPEVCTGCRREIPSNAQFCMRCGRKVDVPVPHQYTNIVHPVSRECRVMIHDAVMNAYRRHRSVEVSATENNPDFAPNFNTSLEPQHDAG